jgi:iron-sulfur cluster repair protein YtfE (RIC family)
VQTNDTVTIDPSWTVYELIHMRPETADALRSYGIDTCCGGTRTLNEAARLAGLDIDALLRALDQERAGGRS